MTELTVIGGGIGGLVAAITAAERGASVTLFEAHSTLGGRWRSTDPPWIAHEGPHVVYRDGPIWAWLRGRHLLGETRAVPPAALLRFVFRHHGSLRRMPPAGLIRALAGRGRTAPVDRSYRDWATEQFGAESAALSAAASGVALFARDPGSLSAAFVWERFTRVFSFPPSAGYRRHGWGALFTALGERARSLGVRIECDARVSTIGPGRTIVATELESARGLLGDPALDWPSGRAALLDLGLAKNTRDAFVVSDLDEAGWLERFSAPDPSLSPPETSLVQLQVPLGPVESKAEGVARLERLADLALPEWRGRVAYRRVAVAHRRSGALDRPGFSWRDRPAIDRGDGVFLVGDRVASPGLLSEVSVASALRAVDLALVGSTSLRNRGG